LRGPTGKRDTIHTNLQIIGVNVLEALRLCAI